MVAAVILPGIAAEAVAWALVVRGRRSVWVVMSFTLAVMGAAALLAGAPSLSQKVVVPVALASGLAGGAVLYLATRAFVAIASGRWPALRRHSLLTYERRGQLPLAAALVLAAVVSAAGEELFWRGLVQDRWSHGQAATGGAALAWLAYVAANIPSANLAIVTGAIVGGAVWASLAWWTNGVLASLACHCLWMALMVVFPVVRPAGDAR